MPSSRCNHIPIVLGIVRELAPRSILDVGVGFGKWGHLFREYTDIAAAEADPARYRREYWQVRIDGIEGHAPYITPMHRYLYNQLYVGDMRSVVHELEQYDLIFLGDVIEHVEKADGLALLRACLEHARLAVVITTPASRTPQGPACANPLEVHRSFWTADEFRRLGRCVYTRDDNDTLVVVLLKDGVPAPTCRAPLRRRRRSPARLIPRVNARILAAIRSLLSRWRSTRVGSSIATAPRSHPVTDLAAPSGLPITPVPPLTTAPGQPVAEQPQLTAGQKR